ncbi:MAG: preprotein translocase subunit SecA, partial [Ruminococcaceae bacterium]|nr:preprotein translocase subunit SecA [Oscillospiraceae bacterium]
KMGIPEEEPIDHPMLSGSIETAQKRRESDNFQRRRTVLEYDDVMNQQRNLIYKERRDVLDGAVISDKVLKMIEESIENALGQYLAGEPSEWDLEGLRRHFFGIIFKENDLVFSEEELGELTVDDIRTLMTTRAEAEYNFRLESLGEERFREIERIILLRAVDLQWMDHLDAMDDLRGSVGLNAYAQRNPLTEYRLAGGEMFEGMVASIREDTVRMILSFRTNETIKREAVSKITSLSSAGDGSVMKKKTLGSVKGEGVAPTVKVGPNDPCPCGSGKKYKKCCGLGTSEK